MLLFALAVALHAATPEDLARYPWLHEGAQLRSLRDTFPEPQGFRRVAVPSASFAAFVRDLPLRGESAPVRRYDGVLLHAPGEAGIAAVAEIDVGRKDLQQCADSILRLWAEWQHLRGEDVPIELTSGDVARFSRYAMGDRAQVRGSSVQWIRSAAPDRSRASFRAFLDFAFTYAGTISLARTARVARSDVRPGDFFVQAGSPGHAVLVLDVARNARGARVALLGQGYTPAQDFHVLATEGAWFSLEQDEIATPFWRPFRWEDLRRLPEATVTRP